MLNLFKIDAFAPGNWEFVYGTSRFLELFAGAAPKAPWGTIAANVYYSTLTEDPSTPFPDKAGQRVLPPYLIKTVGDVKVGIMGFTTDRGPQVVGSKVTKGSSSPRVLLKCRKYCRSYAYRGSRSGGHAVGTRPSE